MEIQEIADLYEALKQMAIKNQVGVVCRKGLGDERENAVIKEIQEQTMSNLALRIAMLKTDEVC